MAMREVRCLRLILSVTFSEVKLSDITSGRRQCKVDIAARGAYVYRLPLLKYAAEYRLEADVHLLVQPGVSNFHGEDVASKEIPKS